MAPSKKDSIRQKKQKLSFCWSVETFYGILLLVMKDFITTYQASKKYGFSTAHLRRLMESKTLEGYLAPTSVSRGVWMIKESSLTAYIKTKPKPGPKTTHKK